MSVPRTETLINLMKPPGHSLNLRQRLLVLLLMASVPGMAVAVWLAADALSSQSRQVEITARQLAALQAAEHGSIVESARIMLTGLVHTDALGDLDRPRCSAFLRNWLERFPSYTSLTLVNAGGEAVCSNVDSEMPPNLETGAWFERVKAERTFVVGEYTPGRNGVPLILAAYPVVDPVQNAVGALVVGIDLRWFDFLARTVDLPPKSSVTALAEDGTVLTHYLARMDGGLANPPVEVGLSRPSVETRRAMVGEEGTIRGETEAGEPRVYGYHRTETGGLVVAVGMPRFLGFDRIGAAMLNTLFAPISILVLALLAAGWASEAFITRWVRRLTRKAGQMAVGERGVRSEVPHGHDEIGQLAAAFDRMADAIDEREEELESAVRQRGILLDEINHRIKNDMQVVISLVRLEASRIDATNARQRLDELVGRIRTLAEVHSLLYRTYEGERAVVNNYAAELCRLLWKFRAGTNDRVDMKTDIEPVPLPMEKAIPFGLVLNELIANAFKHGFNDGRAGTLWIDLRQVDGGEAGRQAKLTVSDDGPGPSTEIDFDQASSTGMTLVRALTQQLDGKFAARRDDGRTTFEVLIPLGTAA